MYSLRGEGACGKAMLSFRDAPHMAVAAALILNESELVVCRVGDVINGQQL